MVQAVAAELRQEAEGEGTPVQRSPRVHGSPHRGPPLQRQGAVRTPRTEGAWLWEGARG